MPAPEDQRTQGDRGLLRSGPELVGVRGEEDVREVVEQGLVGLDDERRRAVLLVRSTLAHPDLAERHHHHHHPVGALLHPGGDPHHLVVQVVEVGDLLGHVIGGAGRVHDVLADGVEERPHVGEHPEDGALRHAGRLGDQPAGDRGAVLHHQTHRGLDDRGPAFLRRHGASALPASGEIGHGDVRHA